MGDPTPELPVPRYYPSASGSMMSEIGDNNAIFAFVCAVKCGPEPRTVPPTMQRLLEKISRDTIPVRGGVIIPSSMVDSEGDPKILEKPEIKVQLDHVLSDPDTYAIEFMIDRFVFEDQGQVKSWDFLPDWVELTDPFVLASKTTSDISTFRALRIAGDYPVCAFRRVPGENRTNAGMLCSLLADALMDARSGKLPASNREAFSKHMRDRLGPNFPQKCPVALRVMPRRLDITVSSILNATLAWKQACENSDPEHTVLVMRSEVDVDPKDHEMFKLKPGHLLQLWGEHEPLAVNRISLPPALRAALPERFH